MGNIPVHPGEAKRAALFKHYNISRKDEFENYLDRMDRARYIAIASEGMLGSKTPAPNTTYGREAMRRQRQRDFEWATDHGGPEIADIDDGSTATKMTGPWTHTLRQGYVYVILAGGRVKIGFTTDLKQRMTQLQVGWAQDFVLLAKFRGTRDDERDLHDRFARTRAHGEWFEIDDNMRAWLKEIGAADPCMKVAA